MRSDFFHHLVKVNVLDLKKKVKTKPTRYAMMRFITGEINNEIELLGLRHDA